MKMIRNGSGRGILSGRALQVLGACVSTVTEKGNTVTAVNYAIYSRKEMTAAEYGESVRHTGGSKTACTGCWISRSARMKAGSGLEMQLKT